MLDHFLAVIYEKSREEEEIQKLASQMQNLPMAELYKIASSGLCGDDESWLSKYKGTQLLNEAVALEQQEIQLEQQRIQKDQAREMVDQQQPREDFYSQKRQIGLQKRLLDLKLVTTSAETPVVGEQDPAGGTPAQGAGALGAEPAEGAIETPKMSSVAQMIRKTAGSEKVAISLKKIRDVANAAYDKAGDGIPQLVRRTPYQQRLSGVRDRAFKIGDELYAKGKLDAASKRYELAEGLNYGKEAAVNWGSLLRHNAAPLTTMGLGAAGGVAAGLSGDDGSVGKAIGYGALGGLGGFYAGRGGQIGMRAIGRTGKNTSFGGALKGSINKDVRDLQRDVGIAKKDAWRPFKGEKPKAPAAAGAVSPPPQSAPADVSAPANAPRVVEPAMSPHHLTQFAAPAA